MASNAIPAYGTLGPVCDPDIVVVPKVTTDPNLVDKTTLTDYTNLDTFPQDADSRKQFLDMLYYNPIVGYGYNTQGELTFVYANDYIEDPFILGLKTDITNYIKSYPAYELASGYYADPVIPGETVITAVPSGTFNQ
jgi:hypothetical protein